MFLERIHELDLLHHNPESDILGGFPLDVKCAMISQMNRYLISMDTYEPAEVLTSPAHVKFAMEMVGQGLDLPLYNITIIAQSVHVYAAWLLEPKKRPLSLIELGESSHEYQDFLQSVFKHLSLIFRPRTLNEGSQQVLKPKESQDDYSSFFNQHLELCERVLIQHILFTVKTKSDCFSEETWIVLLKVLLGICDSLLSKPFLKHAPGASPYSKNNEFNDHDVVLGLMGDKLCESLIKTIFQVWLSSKTLRVDLWDKFKEHFMTWNFRVQIIEEWCSVSLALSNQVIADLITKTPSIKSFSMSGIPESKSEESISKKGRVSFFPTFEQIPSFDESMKTSYYCWHRTIYMLQTPVYLEPLNFQTAIHGISNLVDLFLLFGRNAAEKDSEQESPVNGNTLLNMFGEWLFPAAAMFKSGYEIGRAEAISCLCKIFSQLQTAEPFHQKYLEKFYQVLAKGLSTDFLSLCAVTKHSGKLFSLNLKGFRILTPDYIKGMTRILPIVQAAHADLLGQKIDFDLLRTGAYRILLNTIFSLDILKGIPISFNISDTALNRVIEPSIHSWIDTNYPLKEKQTFEALKPTVIAMLLNSLIVESSQFNCKLLLNLCSSFAAQESKNNNQIFSIFIRIIQDMISLPDRWSSEVVLSAFEVLSFYSSIIDTESEDYGNCAKELTLSLCTFVNNCFKSENLVPHQQRVVKAYDLICKWSLQGKWMLSNGNVQKIVIAALTRGTSILDRDNPYSVISSISRDSANFKSSIISHSTMVALGKMTDSIKTEPGNSITSSMLSNATTTSQVKTSKKNPVISLVPPKRFAKLRLSYAPSGSNLISTASKDGGIGLPTFAVISAEIQIKTAAERALQLLSLRLGNYPANGSCFGVTKLHSGWKEINKCASLARLQNKLKDISDTRFMFPEDYKFIRYFSYQKSIIFGIIELPDWSRQTLNRVPSIAFITINPEGKYSWVGSFEYEEKEIDSNIKGSKTGSLNSFISDVVDHSEVFEKWRNLIEAQKQLQSQKFSVVNDNKNISWANNENIPSTEECQLQELSINYKNLEKNIDRHCNLEDDILNLSSKSRSFIAKPQISSIEPDPDHIPKVFRLFLSTLGFLDYQTRGSISALPITGSLLQDLEKLDDISPRDCFAIDVYYFKSVLEIFDCDSRYSNIVSKEFDEFLWTLGWPIDVQSHTGFKGNLGEICLTTPYFANMSIELIFKTPHIHKNDQVAKSLKNTLSKSSNILLSNSNDFLNTDDSRQSNSTKSRQRAFTTGVEKDVTAEPDSIAIVWLEDIHRVSQLIDQLPMHIAMCLMVHPLKCSNGLYLIKMFAKVGISEECLTVGPLIEDMIIGMDNLGALTRSTAANMFKQFQISKNIYRRPHLTRRQFIEDICARHAISNNGLYTDLIAK